MKKRQICEVKSQKVTKYWTKATESGKLVKKSHKLVKKKSCKNSQISVKKSHTSGKKPLKVTT